MAKCRHLHANYQIRLLDGSTTTVMGCYYIWLAHPDPNFGYGDNKWVISASCYACNAVLSLGPSNDEPEAVTIEIRAADLSAPRVRGRKQAYPDNAELAGMIGHEFDHDANQDDLTVNYSGWLTGWLANEMSSHDLPWRDEKAWSWDTTRPIAGQYDSERMRESIEDHDLPPIRDGNADATQRTVHGSTPPDDLIARHNECCDATGGEIEKLPGRVEFEVVELADGEVEPEGDAEFEVEASHEYADCDALGCVSAGAAHDPSEATS